MAGLAVMLMRTVFIRTISVILKAMLSDVTAAPFCGHVLCEGGVCDIKSTAVVENTAAGICLVVFDDTVIYSYLSV